jgi:hypothetical protein
MEISYNFDANNDDVFKDNSELPMATDWIKLSKLNH